MLLAVLDVRRGTRDADMLARGLASDESSLRAAIGEIASIPMADGVDFDTTAISIATIREGADYEGIRLTSPASLRGAELKLRLDLSFGDPVEPQRIDYSTIRTSRSWATHWGPLLETLRESRQQPWAAYPARVGLAGLPERFADVVDAVIDLVDGLPEVGNSTWNPATQRWE